MTIKYHLRTDETNRLRLMAYKTDVIKAFEEIEKEIDDDIPKHRQDTFSGRNFVRGLQKAKSKIEKMKKDVER